VCTLLLLHAASAVTAFACLGPADTWEDKHADVTSSVAPALLCLKRRQFSSSETVEKSVFRQQTVPVLRLTCSWRVTTYVGKPSAAGRPTRPAQPFILSGLASIFSFSVHPQRSKSCKTAVMESIDSWHFEKFEPSHSLPVCRKLWTSLLTKLSSNCLVIIITTPMPAGLHDLHYKCKRKN